MKRILFLVTSVLLVRPGEASEYSAIQKADKTCMRDIKERTKDLKVKFCQVQRTLRDTEHQLIRSDMQCQNQMIELTDQLDLCQQEIITLRSQMTTPTSRLIDIVPLNPSEDLAVLK